MNVEVTLPDGVPADIDLPGVPAQQITCGQHTLTGAVEAAAHVG